MLPGVFSRLRLIHVTIFGTIILSTSVMSFPSVDLACTLVTLSTIRSEIALAVTFVCGFSLVKISILLAKP